MRAFLAFAVLPLATIAGLFGSRAAEAVIVASDLFAIPGQLIAGATSTAGAGWGGPWTGSAFPQVVDNTLAAPDGRVRRLFSSPLGLGSNNAGTSVYIGFDWINDPGFYNGLEGNSSDDAADSSRVLNLANVGGGPANTNSQKLVIGVIGEPTPAQYLDFADTRNPARYVVQVNFGSDGVSDSVQLYRDGASLGILPSVSDFTLANIGFGDFAGGPSSVYGRLVVATTLAEAALPGAIPLPRLVAEVNRNTGNLVLRNQSLAPVSLAGVTIESSAGALNAANWLSITDNYDQSAAGGVGASTWQELGQNARDLSEVTQGTGVLAVGQSLNLGNVWNNHYVEDLRVRYLDVTGVNVADLNDVGVVKQTFLLFNGGAGNATPTRGDLNFDGTVNAADWALFKVGQGVNRAALTAAQSYRSGDMNGDLRHNLTDFDLFAQAFDSANGSGSFAAMLAVPEPATCGLALLAMGLLTRVGRLARAGGGLLALTLVFASTPSRCDAVVIVQDLFNISGPLIDTPANAGGTGWGSQVWTPPLSGSGVATGAIVSNGALSLAAENRVRRELPSVLGLGNANAGSTLYLGVSMQLNAFYNGFEANSIPLSGADNERAIEIGVQANNFSRLAVRGAGLGAPQSIPFSNANLGVIKNYVVAMNFGANGTSDTIELFINNVSQGSVAVNDFVMANVGFGSFVQQPFPAIESITIGTSLADVIPPTLTLRVDPVTGGVQLRNDSAIPLPLSGYEITSAADSLRPTSWKSLSDTGGAFPVGNGSGNGWEEGPNPGTGQIAEWYLTGQSVIPANTAVYLGQAFAPGGTQDVAGQVRDAPGSLVPLIVAYGSVPVPAVVGDYNQDGVVNAADYTVWRDALGTAGPLPNRAPANIGNISQADYTTWVSRYGQSASSSTAIPEPSGLALLALSIGTSLRRRRRAVVTAAGVAVVSAATSASAAVTLDRYFSMGDDPAERSSGAANNVQMGFTGLFTDNTALRATRDSAVSTTNAAQHLEVRGATNRPFYRTSTIPGAVSGSLMADFDGIDDRLFGDDFNEDPIAETIQRGGLGFPGANGGYPDTQTPQNYLANYNGITQRGVQAWVMADSPTFGSSSNRQDVFHDTFQFGVFITSGATTTGNASTRRWGMVWGAEPAQTDPRSYESQVTVNQNTWYHVMQHSFGLGGGVLYVDGVATLIGGFNGADFYQGHWPGANLNLVVGAGLNNTSNYFNGKVDELKIYVAGDNLGSERTNSNGDPVPGQNFGRFNLATDNDWIARQLVGIPTGDVNRDGFVNNADLSAFATSWKQTRLVSGVQVGDWISRTTMSDLNFDGVCDLTDWSILRRALPGGGSLVLEDVLTAYGVPEPSAAVLIVVACCGLGSSRLRRS
jgi:hypothetical protein